LRAEQKAAAVNLGIFPDAGDTGVAIASANVPSYATRTTTTSMTTDRLAGIDDLLRAPSAPPPAAAPPSWQPQATAPVQTAYVAPVARRSVQAPPTTTVTARKRVWLQLASGPNADALPRQFQRLKSKNRELFDGISGYVARSPDRARLVIGPFRSSTDAQIFAEDLQSVDIEAFSWTNSASDQIVPLGTK
jgi:cell division protein FtsN